MTEQTSVTENNPPRTLVATVVSNKMNKTVVVQIERKVKHPLYGKYVRRFSKMYVHDEENQCRNGDLIRIRSSRPLSKTKRWILVEVLKREEQQ